MKTIRNYIGYGVTACIGLMAPVISLADVAPDHTHNLVPCHGLDCGFNELITLISNLMNYVIASILPLAAVVFVYIGWILMHAGSIPAQRNKAKAAATQLILGIVIMLSAWLIIVTLLQVLGVCAEFIFIELPGRINSCS